jgi:hypothetical protein
MTTALGEVGAGLFALVLPSVAQSLLLGADHVVPETIFFARIAGVALLAIGIACWLGRSDQYSAAQNGLLVSILIYDLAAAVILAYSGYVGLVGIALWPAVLVHCVLAAWCVACLRSRPGSLPS